MVNLNRHSLHLPAQLSRLSETWPSAPALRQNNNTMSRRLIAVVDDSLLTWAAEPTFSALLSACSSGSFFALKPFPTFPFPLHPWTSDFFVYLPCPPPRSTPSLPLLTPLVISPASLNLLPLWVGCTSGSYFAGGAILPFTPVRWQVLRDINHLFQSGDESQALEKTRSLPRRSRGVTEFIVRARSNVWSKVGSQRFCILMSFSKDELQQWHFLG